MALLRFLKRLMAFLLICFCFLPLTAVAQLIDFSNREFHEPVNAEYWKSHPRDGIEVLSFEDKSFPVFRHRISFELTRFYSTADFGSAQFDSAASFGTAQFYSRASFSETKFYSRAYFISAGFHSTSAFSYAQFDSWADFFDAQFLSEAYFKYAQFHSTADLTEAHFHSAAYFEYAHFHSTANFGSAQFDSTASFSGTKFDSEPDFKWAEFHAMANFRRVRFKGKVSFRYATLPNSLDFRDVIDIAKEIDFTSALPRGENDKCRIALTGTDINKIKLNMSLFELWFPADTTFKDSLAGSELIKVIDRIDSSSYDEQVSVYESVLKKLKDDGFMDSYRVLDIDYREFKYRKAGGLNWYVANTFHRLWWNYGYSKELIFLWALGFLFLFSVLNINFYRRLSENVYAIPFLGKWEYDSMRWPWKWIYYWLQVVTYTSIIFFGLKMDIAKFKQGVVRNHPFLFVYLMFIYVLGLICVGFIANIIFTR